LRKRSQARRPGAVVGLGQAKEDVDQNDKRDFYNGFGDGLARAFEFAVTPAIFGFLGYLLDRAIGTLPVFTLILALVCIVGMFLKTYYTYEDAMRAHDAKSPWAKPAPPGAPDQGLRG
jgi:F0F1-type ATP synthase assembly protein I